MNIQVKGTSFDVKTDVENKRVEAVLVSGEIELLDADRNKLLDVSPGEKVTYNQNKNEYTTEAVDVNILTAWRLRQFVFENATLREIVNKLSVKFNVNINIESSALAQRKFRCVIQKLDEVIVIGYGVEKKINMTDAITNVKTEELSSISTTNLSNTLAGRAQTIAGGSEK